MFFYIIQMFVTEYPPQTQLKSCLTEPSTNVCYRIPTPNPPLKSCLTQPSRNVCYRIPTPDPPLKSCLTQPSTNVFLHNTNVCYRIPTRDPPLKSCLTETSTNVCYRIPPQIHPVTLTRCQTFVLTDQHHSYKYRYPQHTPSLPIHSYTWRIQEPPHPSSTWAGRSSLPTNHTSWSAADQL